MNTTPTRVDPHPSARWWEPLEKNRVRCTLCPRYCKIPAASQGFCYVRRNHSGTLVTTAYGRATGFGMDPIEKKPLYHFHPGSPILSFGTIGCNLGCKFCQNWHITKVREDRYLSARFTPGQVVELARDRGSLGIAYTYNDPIIFGEWVVDISALARKAGLKNVLVTNGYITPEARAELFRFVDAANVDLKSIRESFYRRLSLAHLAPVLDTLRWLVHKTTVWVEITNLVIPGENDHLEDLRDLVRFVAGELGSGIPLHFSAFHPDYKLRDRAATPLKTLEQALEIARQGGLKYVYLGNVYSPQGQDTSCPACGRVVIRRQGYHTAVTALTNDRCSHCGEKIAGRFEADS